MGVSQNEWFIWFIVENPNLKRKRTRGTPISGNLHMGYIMGNPISGKIGKLDSPTWDRNIIGESKFQSNFETCFVEWFFFPKQCGHTEGFLR